MQNDPDMTSASFSAADSGAQNPFNAVRRRWKIVVLVFLLVFVSTALYTFLQPQFYEASATIELNSDAGSEGIKTDPADVVVTLQSRLLADLVVQRLNLGWQITAVSPQLKVTIGEFVVTGALPGLHIKLTGPKSFAVYDGSGRFVGEGESGKLLSVEGVRLLLHIESGQAGQSLIVDRQPVAPHIDKFIAGLQVVPLQEGSRLLRVSMQGEDPEYIRDAVNILIEIYRDMLQQESSAVIARIDRQLLAVQSSLDAAERELQKYRQESGLSELAPQGARLVAKVAELEQKKTGLEWQVSQVDSAVERLRQAINNQTFFVAPRIEGFPQISEAATRLAALEAQQRALLSDFTEAHPAVEEKRDEVLQARRELLSLYLSASRELAQDRQRLAENIAVLDGQLNRAPGAELARRTRDQKAQAELFDFLHNKQREIRIAQLAAVNELKIIDPAITPRLPIKPNRVMNLSLGHCPVCCSVSSVRCCSALSDRTFKSVEEMRSRLNLPIYGVIPKIPEFAEEQTCRLRCLLPRHRSWRLFAPCGPGCIM